LKPDLNPYVRYILIVYLIDYGYITNKKITGDNLFSFFAFEFYGFSINIIHI